MKDMQYIIRTKQEKWSIVQRVQATTDKKRELAKLGISGSTYYDWKQNDCQTTKKTPHHIWNQVPAEIEAKIKAYRLSNDPLKHSPARIVEQLELNEGYLITESGVKSVLVRLKLNGMLRPKKKQYHIRPKAEKFLQVVCIDDVEFIRTRIHDTCSLNLTDEASYFAMESKVLGRKVQGHDIVRALKTIRLKYGRYPKMIRLDNARAHHSKIVAAFCLKHGIEIDFITKHCPEENWPVESWHRNLNQDVIYRKGFATVSQWQKAIDEYRTFHNYQKRLRSDPNQRTPAEIAFCYATPLTQARLKAKLKRKQQGQTSVQNRIPQATLDSYRKNYTINSLFVSEMCVS